MQVSATVNGSMATVEQIDPAQLGSVMGKGGTVRMDFSGLEKRIDTVRLPASAVGQVADAAQNGKAQGLALSLSTGEAFFDAAALGSIYQQAQGPVTLQIEGKTKQQLDPDQQKVVGDAPAYSLALESGKSITSFGGGQATITLPYTLRPGQSPGRVLVYYLDSQQKIHPCPTTYDQEAHLASFTTNHFSLYFVGYDSNAPAWSNPFKDVAEDARD